MNIYSCMNTYSLLLCSDLPLLLLLLFGDICYILLIVRVFQWTEPLKIVVL